MYLILESLGRPFSRLLLARRVAAELHRVYLGHGFLKRPGRPQAHISAAGPSLWRLGSQNTRGPVTVAGPWHTGERGVRPGPWTLSAIVQDGRREIFGC